MGMYLFNIGSHLTALRKPIELCSYMTLLLFINDDNDEDDAELVVDDPDFDDNILKSIFLLLI